MNFSLSEPLKNYARREITEAQFYDDGDENYYQTPANEISLVNYCR